MKRGEVIANHGLPHPINYIMGLSGADWTEICSTHLPVNWSHPHHWIPGPLEQQGEGLTADQVQTGVDHLLHQHRAL